MKNKIYQHLLDIREEASEKYEKAWRKDLFIFFFNR